jgi:hypothetical protein
MSTLLLNAFTDAWATLYYGARNDCPKSAPVINNAADARRAAWNAFALMASPTLNTTKEVPILESALASVQGMQLSSGAFDPPDTSDNEHNSALGDGVELPAMKALADSGLLPAVSGPWLTSIDKNTQYLVGPDATAYNASRVNYSHRDSIDASLKLYQYILYPTSDNLTAFNTSFATLQGDMLGAGYRIALMPYGWPGQIIAPGGTPTPGNIGLESAYGVMPERDHSGLTSQVVGYDASYQMVDLYSLATLSLMAQDAGLTSIATAANTLIGYQQDLLTRCITPNGVNIAGCCRVGGSTDPVTGKYTPFETDPTTGAGKTYDVVTAKVAAQLAYHATGVQAWATARDMLVASYGDYGRICTRIAQPGIKTTEYIKNNALQIGITMPYDQVTTFAPQFPTNGGPDTLTITYTDQTGQPQGPLTLNLTFWMSDAGYCFISADGTKQFLIAGVNGAFFDANCTAINNRNITASATPLAGVCMNAGGYGYTTLLPNQVRPVTSIVNGQTTD